MHDPTIRNVQAPGAPAAAMTALPPVSAQKTRREGTGARITLAFVVGMSSISGLAIAEEPDGLILPAGFHATVVAEGLGNIRHLAVRENGNIYVSTPQDPKGGPGGIFALHLDANHHADKVERFSSIDGGTGIRFHDGALYAASSSSVYRFTFRGQELVPSGEPELIVDGMPVNHSLPRTNRILAFDGQGNLVVALAASANICADPKTAQGAPPVGLRPCPDLSDRAGIWRFNAKKIGQKFPADGEQLATGIRDITSLEWSPADGNLYGIMHGRDNASRFFPNLIDTEDDNDIADEMHRVNKGTDFGWPYTYYDGVRKIRLIAPEYGGDGKKLAPPGAYSNPVLTFQSRRPAPVDLVFYSGKRFPAEYQGGAFIVLHGTNNKNGYNVVFVPFNRSGVAGTPKVFADGFANLDPSQKTPAPPKYRPVGAAVAPDGALYIADSQKGRIWRITYGTD